MDPLVWLVLLLLVGLSALYVASEFSAVGVRPSQLAALADERPAAAQLLALIGEPRRLERYVAGTQVGITLSSLVLGAYGQAKLTPVVSALGPQWAAAAPWVVLLGMTGVLLVVGELLPKYIALADPLRVSLLTMVPMRWSLRLFWPLIALVDRGAAGLLAVLGVTEERHRHIHSAEEIALLVAESHRGGQLEAAEEQRLHRALRLSELTARQIMVPRPYLDSLDIATPADEALARVLASDYTRLLVWRGSPDQVVGVLHSRDVVRALAERGVLGDLEALLRPLPAISEHVSADRVLSLLRERRSEWALVVDEYGGLAGLVTAEDVLTRILPPAGDTGLGGQPEPARLPDGRVRLPGLLQLADAEAWLGVRWEGEAETVGGRVAEELGHLPAVGERLTIDGVEIEVAQVAHQAVHSILAVPRAPEVDDA